MGHSSRVPPQRLVRDAGAAVIVVDAIRAHGRGVEHEEQGSLKHRFLLCCLLCVQALRHIRVLSSACESIR